MLHAEYLLRGFLLLSLEGAERDHSMSAGKPRIAMAMGDPAGISPEIAAKLLASPAVRQAAELIIFGDRRVLEAGAKVAGVPLDIEVFADADAFRGYRGMPVLLDQENLDPAGITLGKAVQAGGRFAIHNFRSALHYAAAGLAAAVFFTPFNKHAMRLAHPSYDDEINLASSMCSADCGMRG
jgi:4-hydroxythreonine-4-phosphate dehydrogenase